MSDFNQKCSAKNMYKFVFVPNLKEWQIIVEDLCCSLCNPRKKI